MKFGRKTENSSTTCPSQKGLRRIAFQTSLCFCRTAANSYPGGPTGLLAPVNIVYPPSFIFSNEQDPNGRFDQGPDYMDSNLIFAADPFGPVWRQRDRDFSGESKGNDVDTDARSEEPRYLNRFLILVLSSATTSGCSSATLRVSPSRVR